MIAVSLISLFILIGLAIYMAFNEQLEVEEYDDKVANATNIMAKMGQAHLARDFVEASKKTLVKWRCSKCYRLL